MSLLAHRQGIQPNDLVVTAAVEGRHRLVLVSLGGVKVPLMPHEADFLADTLRTVADLARLQ